MEETDIHIRAADLEMHIFKYLQGDSNETPKQRTKL